MGGDLRSQNLLSKRVGNLGKYDLQLNSFIPLGTLDNPVNSLVFHNEELYIGGEFTKNNVNDTVNHLGVLFRTLNIPEIDENNYKLHPNPFSSVIHIEGVEDNSKYILYSSTGQLLKSGKVENERIDELQALPKGAYILEVETKHGVFRKKMLK